MSYQKSLAPSLTHSFIHPPTHFPPFRPPLLAQNKPPPTIHPIQESEIITIRRTNNPNPKTKPPECSGALKLTQRFVVFRPLISIYISIYLSFLSRKLGFSSRQLRGFLFVSPARPAFESVWNLLTCSCSFPNWVAFRARAQDPQCQA